jgi:hypothetical protein
MDTALADGRADFDFEIGRWQVRRLQLKQSLQRSPDWVEFTGVAHSTRLNPSTVDTSIHASSGLIFLQPRTGGSRLFRRWQGRLGNELDPGSQPPTEVIGGERQLAH